jgi:hypothetical protein
MKTPREFLLGRHDASRLHLDEIRCQIVGKIEIRRRSLSSQLWQELILPVRRAWICLAAAWVVILAMNLITGRNASIAGAVKSESFNPDTVIALQRQERLMAQLIEDDNGSASPAKPAEQRPRSEAPVEYKIV